ncbi:MAG: YfbM family protein [Nostoc sp.]|uniref:YfbM family protein n=1 Tax=Nostoc sp. TaxID=1180 RepID=UPI002FF5139C
MGINGIFMQLSHNLLEKLKQEPGLIRVFTHARYVSESDLMQGKGIFLYYKEFDEIKADIPLVIAEGRNEELDIDKAWHIMHFILTNDSSWKALQLPFLVYENSDSDGLSLVNAVMGGTPIEEYDRDFTPVRYLTNDEVKQVAEALPGITKADLKKRLNQAIILNIDIYKYTVWLGEDDELLEDLIAIKQEITEYYQDAAKKGNAMLLYLS